MKELLVGGCKEILTQKTVVVFMYMVQVLISVIVGMQVWQVLEASIGDSLSMNIIQEGFNRTVFEDFLAIHGASISPLIGLLRWIIPVFLIISVYMHAGLVSNILNDKKGLTNFFLGGLENFVGYLQLTLLFIGMVIIWSIIIWLPFLIWIGNPIENFSSEVPVFWAIIIFATIYLIGIIILWLWSFCAKLDYIKQHKSISVSFKNGWSRFKKGFWKINGWLYLSLFITIVLYFAYCIVSELIPSTHILLIISTIIIQQVFNFFRIVMRVFLYHGIASLTEIN